MNEKFAMKINGATLSLTQGDLTVQDVDAIVNAANSGLMGGGGVDGAIHRAGGPAILEECKAIVGKMGRLPTGQAVMTTAGKMRARHVIHTVGPIWQGGTHNEADLLSSAYRESLKLAAAHHLTSVAFPSISTGVYGYPVELAAPVALGAVKEFLEHPTAVKEVVLVLHDAQTMGVYAGAMRGMRK
jgi:O-acetyl-ADP-ribose deacetylase